MNIPKLNPSDRAREYKQYSFEEISQIVRTWLFEKKIPQRDMDRDILNLDSDSSGGWQSMGVLHHLGLKREFKGIFAGLNLNQAINQLKEDGQDFGLIIELLENTSENSNTFITDSLYETGKSQDKNFEDHYRHRLDELETTDAQTGQIKLRKEQGILRAIHFKGFEEKRCAICSRILPTNVMVAAHIKPRSKCITSERKNHNVVMPVCKVGCDDFFEKFYILVNPEGLINVNKMMKYTSDLESILAELDGKKCTHFNQDTEGFFDYKRESFDLLS